MLLIHDGRTRPSARRTVRLTSILALAAVFAVGGLATRPITAEAAGRKVVIVVGPAGSSTANYILNARKLAAQARSYGAAVDEIYSPNATWARVLSVAQGASLFIYLGHGNGWPSPYPPFALTGKDGIGLNATAGRGNYNVKYWGEYYIDHYINLAPHAVVILNRLCYASGDSEWGRANPTRAVAIQRVDNYGAGFWRANAKAVFAEGISSASYVLYGLFKTNKTMADIFWSAPSATRTYSFGFPSLRSVGASALMDPYAPSRYYRSVVGLLSMTAATWRAG
ncbi:MAG: hypothetical protein M3067_02195 [Chloroflexota bacterium]|nr:hypothetical protein [Chloroflexota bacterium]